MIANIFIRFFVSTLFKFNLVLKKLNDIAYSHPSLMTNTAHFIVGLLKIIWPLSLISSVQINSFLLYPVFGAAVSDSHSAQISSYHHVGEHFFNFIYTCVCIWGQWSEVCHFHCLHLSRLNFRSHILSTTQCSRSLFQSPFPSIRSMTSIFIQHPFFLDHTHFVSLPLGQTTSLRFLIFLNTFQ